MNAFLPNMDVLFLGLMLMGIAVCGGFMITRIHNLGTARIIAWGFAIANTIVIERICTNAAPGFRMLAIIAVMLYSMKCIVCIEAKARDDIRLSFSTWLIFTVFWFGMNPSIFVSPGPKPLADSRKIFFQGVKNFLGGAFLIFFAKFVSIDFPHTLLQKITCTVFLLVGLSMMLHFGLLNITAGILRWKGVNAHKLFNAPLRSCSLTEFWGRRWNIAFSEMTAQVIYRPLTGPFGKTTALLSAFLFSGILHEAAISLPVKAGFGLPLLYFALHAVLMQIEQKLEKEKMAINTKPWIGKCWTIFWLVAPAPLLFHPYFLKGIIWPIIGLTE